jgi:hypothetical protein
MNLQCPNCGSSDVGAGEVTEYFPYGAILNAFQATFPVMTCRCGFGWRDDRAEDAIAAAQALYCACGGV